MTFDSEKHHRRSVRLAGYDYRAGGAYFVTICTQRKRCVFGRMENTMVRLHPFGRIVQTCWEAAPDHFSNVVIDEFIVMPDHFHGILVIVRENNLQITSPTTSRKVLKVPSGSLGAILRSFKSAVTRQINVQRAERNLAPVVVWQRSFHDRIIRSEKELEDTRRYIIENPFRRANNNPPA